MTIGGAKFCTAAEGFTEVRVSLTGWGGRVENEGRGFGLGGGVWAGIGCGETGFVLVF